MKVYKNKKIPKVSIVIAVYNCQEFISSAINCIIKQSYKNWELLIVNDGSTDLTKKIICSYESEKIKIINLKNNIGPYRALDLAFKKCKGKYIAILDADDISHPKRLESQVIKLDRDDKIGLVCTLVKGIDENNEIIKSISRFVSNKDFNNRFPCENLIGNSSVMFRKNLIKELGYYNNSFFYSCDYNFFLKVFLRYKIRIIKKYYTFHRFHKNQRTKTLKKKIIFKENIQHLNWALKQSLINKNNIFIFINNYLKNIIKYLANLIIVNLFNFARKIN
jgi:glycosyltransferase involved in cell wall biosynthesis